jgi:hypothetical protein
VRRLSNPGVQSARLSNPGSQPASQPLPRLDPSVEKGSTLEAYRLAEQQSPAESTGLSMTASRRPTDAEMQAIRRPGSPAPEASPSVLLSKSVEAEAQNPLPRPALVPANPPVVRSKTPLIIAAVTGVLLLVGGIAVGGKLLTPPNPSVPATPPPTTVTEAPPPATAPPVAANPATPPQPAADPQPPPTSPAPPANTAAATSSTTTTSTTTSRPAKAETIPEAVRQELEEARRALDSGDYAKAIRVAQRTLSTQRTEAATLLIGKAHCHLRDLSNARAQWRNLSKRGQSELRTYCSKHDVSLSQ